jgi:fluoride exporter
VTGRADPAAVAAVALGGAAGAGARFGLGVVWPDPVGSGFPWTTFAVNVTGCLAIGVLLAALEASAASPVLVRPLLGTGFLGGYTTLSTYADQTRALLAAGRWVLAAVYLLGTLVAAVVAVGLGRAAVRRIGRRR